MEFKGICLKQDSVFLKNVAFIFFLQTRCRYMVKRFKHRFNSNFQIISQFSTNFFTHFCLFGAVKLTKNADPDNYGYSGYGLDSICIHNFDG